MEVNLKVTVNQLNSGGTVQLFDSTLDYDAVTNPGGWCTDALGPNPQRTDVTELVIKIEKGDLSEELTYTDAADIADYLDPTHGIVLNSTDLFGTAYDVFEDGIYTITITMTGTYDGSAFSVYDEIYEALLWNMWNEIRHLVITIDVPISDYRQAYNAALLNMLFDSIIFNCQYGRVAQAQKIIDYVSSVLDNNTSLTELFKNFENYG